jgi:hypothetical protein
MSDPSNPLIGETLIALDDAAKDFGGVAIPYNTLKVYAYQGVKGLKLETIYINKRYTSKEAIRRFIERRQCLAQKPEKPKVQRLTQRQVDAGLKRHGIVK